MPFIPVRKVTQEEVAAHFRAWGGSAIIAIPQIGHDLVILDRAGQEGPYGPLVNLGQITQLKFFSPASNRSYLVQTATLPQGESLVVSLHPEVGTR